MVLIGSYGTKYHFLTRNQYWVQLLFEKCIYYTVTNSITHITFVKRIFQESPRQSRDRSGIDPPSPCVLCVQLFGEE
jgi:hypothetical protein